MKPHLYDNFAECINQASYWLKHRSKVVHTDRWQGTDISKMPEMATFEVAHCSFGVKMEIYDRTLVGLAESRNNLIVDTGANIPWADDHFWERVSGTPMNPGSEWKKWPYGHSAEKFLDEHGKFNHNYMERYWPKLAGLPQEPTFSKSDWNQKFEEEQHARPDMIMPRHTGIKYNYGDLNDVVNLLAEDNLTRQAYLPVWFPEDTGGGSKRAPCTIGYHFLIRDDRLSINYHIRSCDFLRHFRDDLYLTARLAQWVVDRLGERNDGSVALRLGNFYMQIGSLHLFRNDAIKLWG
jgi:Thymidylate synthase